MSYDKRGAFGSLYQTFEALRKHGGLGDYCFVDDDSAIFIRMPDGPHFPSENGTLMRWPLKPGHNQPGIDPNEHWQWDGNRDYPTLTPSLHWEGVWHGWLRAGKLESV